MDKIVIYVVAVLVLLGGVFLVSSLLAPTPSKYNLMLFVNMEYTNGSVIEGSLYFSKIEGNTFCGSDIPCTLKIEGPVNFEVKDFDKSPQKFRLEPGKYKLVFDEYSDGKTEAEFDFNVQRTVYLKEPVPNQVIKGTDFDVRWDEKEDGNGLKLFWYLAAITDKTTNFKILGKDTNKSDAREMKITLDDYYGEYFEAKRPLCRSHQILFFYKEYFDDFNQNKVNFNLTYKERHTIPIIFDYWIPQDWYKQQKGGENKTAKQWLIDSGQGADCFNDE